MAGREQEAVAEWFTPLDALRRVQELGAQLSGVARSFLEPSGDAETTNEDAAGRLESSRGSLMPQPFVAWAERAAELSTMWVTPMRAVLQEQQDLIDAMSSWAEEQRKLADRFSELADRHRQLTEGVMSALTPTLDHLDRLAGRTTAGERRQGLHVTQDSEVRRAQTLVTLNSCTPSPCDHGECVDVMSSEPVSWEQLGAGQV